MNLRRLVLPELAVMAFGFGGTIARPGSGFTLLLMVACAAAIVTGFAGLAQETRP